jgi:signal transduction histidine kinase
MQSIFEQFFSPSLGLIVLLIAVAMDVFLAFAVYVSNRKSATNIIFSLLAIFTTPWVLANYAVGLSSVFDVSLYIHRLGITFAALMSACFLMLAHTLPGDSLKMKKAYVYVIVLLTAGMVVLNMSPYAFMGVVVTNGVSNPVAGPGLIPFSLISTIFSILAVYVLIRKYIGASGNEKKQIGLVLTGIISMLALIIGTVLVPLIVSGSLGLIALSPVYLLIFLGMTAYAITKYALFNIKVLVTEALTLLIVLVLAGRLFGEATLNGRIIDGLVLVFMTVFGFFLVKSVRIEVRQREELHIANEGQKYLLSVISHGAKNFLYRAWTGYIALAEGSIPASNQKSFIEERQDDAMRGNKQLIATIDSVDFEKGTLSFDMQPINISAIATQQCKNVRRLFERKGIQLIADIPEEEILISADQTAVELNIVYALLENAWHYTKSGTVQMTLQKIQDEVFLLKSCHFYLQKAGTTRIVGITIQSLLGMVCI